MVEVQVYIQEELEEKNKGEREREVGGSPGWGSGMRERGGGRLEWMG